MMKDVIIKIDQNSMVYKQDTVLGISYENLQGKLIFKFLGTFPDGTAYLEYERGTEKGYIPMNKVEETYEVEIKSSLLTKEGRIYLQLRVTENSEPEGIPIFKSNKFYLEVKEAINATTEIPDEYPEWIDTANEKIKEMDNINITTERVDDGVNINVTGKDGKTTTTEVKDGAPGPQGPQGTPGAVKMQVVDTLPDVGETDTIYLLKKEKPGVQNLYDEYVYTDSGWEHIGDTSVDLSDYYTKEESDNKIFESISVFSLSDSRLDFKSGEWSTDSYTIENINKIINNNLGKFVTITIRSTKPGQSQYVVHLNMCFDSPTVLKDNTNQYITGICITNENSTSNVVSTKQFRLSYNVKEIGKINIYQLVSLSTNDEVSLTNNRDVLTKNNTTTYTPTGDYNPATKKYVDNNKYTLPIATTDILGGVKIGDSLDVGEDGVINLKDKGIKELIDATIDLTTMDPGCYIIGGTKTIIKQSNVTIHSSVFSNNQSRAILMCMRLNNSGYGSGILIESNRISIAGYTNKRSRIILYNYDGYDVLDASTILFKDNTISYTPKSDYNPATKKYVDDNIKTYTAGDNITISEDDVISSRIGLPVLENQEIDINTFPVGSYIITGVDTVIKYGRNSTSSYKPVIRSSGTGNVDSWILNIVHDSSNEAIRGFAFLFANYNHNGTSAFYTFDFHGMTSINVDQLMEKNKNQSIYGEFNFYNKLPISSLVPSRDNELTNKKYVDDAPTAYTGYDASKTQVLKNINGTLTWVDEI